MSQSPNVRLLALDILLECSHGEAYAHDLIERLAAQHRLEHRDAAFLQTLVFSVLRNILLLDTWLDELCDNKRLEIRVHWLLRLGVAQLLLLEMPAHAAVNETVNLAGAKPRALVNAVLRRAEREKAALLAMVDRMPLQDRFSHPEWLVDRWCEQHGDEATLQLCEWDQKPADTYIRINRLHPEPLAAADTADLAPTAHPEFYRVPQPPREWLVAGKCYVQDPSTAAACELLDPQPGETVLDACAAPGGKTAYLAQLMRNRGRIIACDASPRRVKRLQENLERLGVTIAETPVLDWSKSGVGAFGGLQFDRILVDAPCSNTGVMRRRVDVRWRLQPWTFKEMATLQSLLLENLHALLKPGGTLVYSTCSIDREENEDVIEAFRATHRHFKLVESEATLPWRDQVDGAFAAKLVKKG